MFEQKYATLSRMMESWIRENPTNGRLPGVRKFSSMFGVDKKTVGKAMRLLVRRGVIRVNGPQGTFPVSRPGGSPGHHAIGILGIASTAGSEKLIDYLNCRSRKFGYKVVALDLKAEDYELLRLLAESDDKLAERICGEVFRAFDDCDNTAEAFEGSRGRLIDALEKIN